MSAALALLLAASLHAGEWAPAWPPLPRRAAEDGRSKPPECPAPAQGPDQSPRQPLFEIRRLEPGAVPLFTDDLAASSALEAAARTEAYWRARPSGVKIEIGGRVYTAARLAATSAALREVLALGLTPEALRAELARRFDAFEAVTENGGREGTVTAYYDPEFPVSAEARPDHVPVLSRPADLVKIDPGLGLDFDWGRKDGSGALIPYHTRAEVSGGVLAGRGLELYWMRHAADLLILQTEGSGWGRLPGGQKIRLAFDGANGRVFRSVGKTLIDCGLIPPGTDSFEILRYLKSQSPERERALVDVNPRYVFFKGSQTPGGPWGATGVELVAGRSIAIDPKQVPLGLPGILASRKPVADERGDIKGFEDFARMIFTHDTGSAIRGPVRVDLFWGAGVKAAAEAHRMLFPGRLVFLVLKP